MTPAPRSEDRRSTGHHPGGRSDLSDRLGRGGHRSL